MGRDFDALTPCAPTSLRSPPRNRQTVGNHSVADATTGLAMRSPAALPAHLRPRTAGATLGQVSSALSFQPAVDDIVMPPGHPSLSRRKGRKWSLPSEGQLGLLLFYICNTMNHKYLCLAFGVTPNVCSFILRNILKIVVCCLHFHPAARIQFPSAEKCICLPA